MKYRIVKHNKLNWVIQEWQDAGAEITRGRHVGKETKGLWKIPKVFYPSLRRAALDLLDIAAGDALLSGEAQSVLDALKIAETRVQATLAVIDMGVACPPPLSISED